MLPFYYRKPVRDSVNTQRTAVSSLRSQITYEEEPLSSIIAPAVYSLCIQYLLSYNELSQQQCKSIATWVQAPELGCIVMKSVHKDVELSCMLAIIANRLRR